MALPEHIQDREMQKFGEDSSGNTFVRTYGPNGSIIDVQYDSVSLEYCGTNTKNVTSICYIKSSSTQLHINVAYDSTITYNITHITSV